MVGPVSPTSLTSHLVNSLLAGPQAGRGAWHSEHQGPRLRDWQHVLQDERWPGTRRCTCCLYSELIPACAWLRAACRQITVTSLSAMCAREASLGVPPSRCPSKQHHAGLCAAACAVSVLLRVALQFLAFGLVIGLLATASAMKWTVTAQLICNTPTMILEVGCEAVPLCLQCPQTEPLAGPFSVLRYSGRPVSRCNIDVLRLLAEHLEVVLLSGATDMLQRAEGKQCNWFGP